MRGSLYWVASGVVGFSGASSETYVPLWTWHIVGCRPIQLFLFLAEACIASAMIYAWTTFGLLVFFSWGIPPIHSDWSLSCDHGLDDAS